jgi:hypothetical protein
MRSAEDEGVLEMRKRRRCEGIGSGGIKLKQVVRHLETQDGKPEGQKSVERCEPKRK